MRAHRAAHAGFPIRYHYRGVSPDCDGVYSEYTRWHLQVARLETIQHVRWNPPLAVLATAPCTLIMLMSKESLQDLLWVSCYGCASEASISLNFSPRRRSEVVSMNYPIPKVSGSKWDINHLRVLYVKFSENLPFDRLFRDSWRSDEDPGESVHNYIICI